MNEKIHIERVGNFWRFRFQQHLEGVHLWAKEEIGATFCEATETEKWHYTIKATRSNSALIKRTAPITLDGCASWRLLESQLPATGYTIDRYLGQQLPQPAKRVGDLWGHQLGGYKFIRDAKDNGRAAGCGMLAMGMGCGKSKTLIDILQNYDGGLNLILCPSRVLGVWRGQFRQFAPDVRILIKEDGEPVAKFVARVSDFIDWGKRVKFSGHFVVIVNYDSARIEPLKSFILSKRWHLAALDESHRCKNAKGTTGRMIQDLQSVSIRRICLTGTPMPHSPEDLFSQFYFIDPKAFGRSYPLFIRRYKVAGWHGEDIGWRNKEEMSRIFHTYAFEVSSDVLDLPPLQLLEQEFSLPPATQKIYRDLWRTLVAEVEAGTCTADNALVKLIRAQQITSGFLPLDKELGDEEQKIEALDTAKASMLGDILEDVDSSETVVVFAKHRYDLDRIREQAEKLGRTYGEVSGRRNDLTKESKIPEGISVFGAQIQSGGVGVDFTRSNLGVLYSIDFNLGNYQQILKRLHRPGQTKPVRFIKLIAEGTVDRRIYHALQHRQSVIESVIEAIKGGSF